MKRKLFTVTDTGWWDTDMTVLPYLREYFEPDVCLIAAKDNNKFSAQQLRKFRGKYGIPVKVISRIGRIRNPLNVLRFLKMYLRITLRKTPGSIINYVYMYDPYINLIMLMFSPARVIVSIHDYEEHIGLNNGMRQRLKQMIINRYDCFHFFSEKELKQFHNDYPEKKAFYTPMPLKDFGMIAPNQSPLFERGQAKRVLLFMGFIRHYKGLDLLIGAAAKLQRTDYKIIIAGTADDWTEFEGAVKANPQIEAHVGFINEEEVGAYFSQSDFLVLPYRSATQSGPALIAMHYNLPIIASDLECFTDGITNGMNGFIFERENIEALAQTLNAAINLTTDEYDTLRMGQKQRTAAYKAGEAAIGETFNNFVNRHMKAR